MASAGNPTRAPRNAFAVLLVLGLGGLAVVARFVTGSPLWLDEALSVDIAALPLGSIPEALRHDGHPPLYYFLLHVWMEVVGDGDVAVRMLSGIMAVATLPLAWLAGRRIGGPRVAWSSALLLALSPFAVRYATETRMYALVMLLVFAGHLLVRRAVDERAAPLPLLAGVAASSGALALSHYWSLFLAAAVVAVVAWWGRRAGSPERRTAVRLVVALAAGGVAFAPWLPSFLEQAAHTGTPWAAAARPTVVLNETIRDFGGGVRAESSLLAIVLVGLVLLGVLAKGDPIGAGEVSEDGKTLRLSSRPAPSVAGEAAVAALTLGIGAAVGLATASTFASRYASVVFPLVVLVAGRGLALVPRRRPALAVGAAVVGLSLVGVAGNIVDDRTQAAEHAAAIAGRADPGRDAVVVCPDQLGPATRRALDGAGLAALPLYAYPTLGDGLLVDWYDYAERNDAADPAAVAATLLERVDPTGQVWVISNPAYRTFEGDCERLLDALSSVRGAPTLVLQDGGSQFFEHATLVLLGPAPG